METLEKLQELTSEILEKIDFKPQFSLQKMPNNREKSPFFAWEKWQSLAKIEASSGHFKPKFLCGNAPKIAKIVSKNSFFSLGKSGKIWQNSKHHLDILNPNFFVETHEKPQKLMSSFATTQKNLQAKIVTNRKSAT